MTRNLVTDVFGLSEPVPFVNVHVDHDNRLFIDPSAIRVAAQRGDPYAKRAHTQLVDFFTEVIRCARSTNTTDTSHGRRLLQSMHEPRETRLGYSARDHRGKAFGEKMGSRLWDEIVQNRARKSGLHGSEYIQDALLSRLERVPLFIARVDRDLISDMATRIIFDVLHEFTLDMVGRYPTIGSAMSSAFYPIWDTSKKQLVETMLDLPSVNGQALLLVPEGWVYWRSVMDPDVFYNRYTTTAIQTEQTTYSSDGKALKPTKKVIKTQNKSVKQTNVREATKYAEQFGRDLAREYQDEIDSSFEPLNSEDIRQRLA